MMTLEEVLQEFSRALEVERQANWVLGDIGCEAVKHFGKDIIGKLAETARCSKERIRQLIVVAYTFPIEYRYPDIPWSFYRKVCQTAKRTGDNAIELLEFAVNNNWSEKDLASYKTENRCSVRKVLYRCTICECKMVIEGVLKPGLFVHCPICAAEGREVVLGVIGDD